MKKEIIPEKEIQSFKNQPVISLADIESLMRMDFSTERIYELAIKRTNQLRNE